MRQEFEAGPVVVRLDFLLVIAGAAIIASPIFAVCLALAVTLHELGHASAARGIAREPFRLLIQLSGGRAYVRRASERQKVLILAAGPIAGAVLVVLGAQLMRVSPAWGYELFYASLIWTGYQLAPFPPMDGGQLFRMLLDRRMKSATTIWRASWIAGFVYVALIVALDHAFIAPAIWLTAMALILGRGEAGYVRHLDAWTAWERGDHPEVVRRVRAIPDYLDKRDRIPLLSLGVTAALELSDRAAIEELCGKLPPFEPAVIDGATWLLTHEKPYGAKLAERAFDALDAERIKRDQIDAERWSEMAFRLAVFEAKELRPESALGVLERAVNLGYAHKERIDAEPAFAKLGGHPKWKQILDRLS